MSHFYETPGTHIFNPNLYLDHWKKHIGLDITEELDLKKKRQSLASHVKNLWVNFNENRMDLKKDYMDTRQGIQAYLASFLLSNVERIFHVLMQSENVQLLEMLLQKHAEELVVADFGAGPLSATVGLLAAIEHLADQNPNLRVPQKVTVYAIDRSEKMVETGTKLIQSSLLNPSRFSVNYVTSPLKIQQKAHIALCANIFNEIPEKHRLKTLASLYDQLENSALLLILEPAQEIHSKALGALRDDLIQSKNDCAIVSPCTHRKPCPMSNRTNRSDWCWFRHFWKPPLEQSHIDKLTGIDHVVLNYSYVFFQKDVSNEFRSEAYARVVSNPFKVNTESDLNKILLCSKDGKIESILVEEDEAKSYQRGDVFQR